MDKEVQKIFDDRPEICTFRVLDYDSIYSSSEHIPTAHELLYVLDGEMTLRMPGGLNFRAVPGDFLLVPGETPHRDEFARVKGLRIMILQFRWENREFFRRINNHTLTKLSYEVRCECRRRLEFMRAHRHNSTADKLHFAIQLHAILMLFFFDLTRVAESAAAAPSADIPVKESIRRAKHFMEQNFMDQLTLKQVAAHAGISPAYLSRLFHREYGISFHDHLTAIRLTAAAELLQTSSLQVAEVAARCGFASSSYFIKVFCSHFGTTPGNYAGQKGRSD